MTGRLQLFSSSVVLASEFWRRGQVVPFATWFVVPHIVNVECGEGMGRWLVAIALLRFITEGAEIIGEGRGGHEIQKGENGSGVLYNSFSS
jgi:hypothetical protein